MRFFRFSLSSALVAILVIAGLFMPVSQAYAISDWPFDRLLPDPVPVKDLRTHREFTAELVPTEENDSPFLIKPLTSKAKLEVTYRSGGALTWFPVGPKEADLIQNLRVAFNKTIKNIRDSLNTCYKKLDEATKKKNPAEQDKAMKTAIEALNKDYKKYLSALPGELYVAINNGKQPYEKFADELNAWEMPLKLSINGLFLPAAPGLGSKIFSSTNREIQKEHNQSLDMMPLFRLARVENDPEAFSVTLSHNWQHSVHAFIESKDMLSVPLTLPKNLTNEQISEVCQKVRDYLCTETSRFDTSVLKPYNEKVFQLVVDPKKTQENYDKLATERTSALQKEQIALKSKMPDAINKIVRDALSIYPAYKGNPELRNYGVDIYDNAYETISSKFSQLKFKELYIDTFPKVKDWQNELVYLNNSLENLAAATGVCLNFTVELSQQLSDCALSIASPYVVTDPKSINNAEYKALLATMNKVKKTFEPFNDFRRTINNMKAYLAFIERAMTKNKAAWVPANYKAVMTELPKIYKVIEEITPLIVSMDHMQNFALEYDAMVNKSSDYQNEGLRAFMQKTCFAMSAAITKAKDSMPLIAFNNLSKVLESASTLDLGSNLEF